MPSIASLSIAARVTLDMHSLNNEGNESNQIQTRIVEIVDHTGTLHSVNAISGDMLKHILMEHFYQLARDRHVALCDGCRRFNANRINADEDWLKEWTKGQNGDKPDAQFIDAMIERCAMDDVAGILITAEKRSIPRKSISEFGWVIGLPERTRTESYLHVKYVSERSKDRLAADAADQKTGRNLGQSIFHRPASSGVYALVCHLELGRIGYNDIKQEYAIGDDERQKRAALLLESLLHTFIELNGAMRSAQLPHLVALEGIITTSSGVLPAPLVSPLMEETQPTEEQKTPLYWRQTEEIVNALNGTKEPQVQAFTFDSISGFASRMRSLVDTVEPFKMLERA